MGKKWAVFGEWNIYTGCDDFLGYIDTDDHPSLDVIQAAEAKFPHNKISHINGKDGIIHMESEIESLREWQERETYIMRRKSSRDKTTPDMPSDSKQRKQESTGGWCIVALFVLAILLWLAMNLPPIG